ncbi:MAG: porin [Melioribacteraceae bacterium]
MNNRGTVRIVVLLTVFLMNCAVLFAQDAKVPGGAEKVPMGVEQRNGKLVFESKDGDYQWWFDSRLQFDGAIFFENKNPLSNGTLFRRVTFATKAVLGKNWQAEVDLEFAEQLLELRDVWAQFTFPTVNLSLRAGNFKEPFGMERLNSSRLLTFLERSSVSSAFPRGRRVGVAARYWTDYAQVTAGVFGHEPGTKIDKGTTDEGFSANVRTSFAPINENGKNLHIGAAYAYTIPDASPELAPNTIELNARTENYVFDPKFLHTGDIGDVNYYNRLGGELMGIYGQFYFQAEYMATKVVRWYGKEDVDVSGAYGMLVYNITGETRYYYADEGEVGPIEAPKHSWGALEVAFRYSTLDLNDLGAGIKGGKSKQMMFGFNYYPNLNIKLQFNYSIVDLDEYATSKGRLIGNDDHSFIQMRVQASL